MPPCPARVLVTLLLLVICIAPGPRAAGEPVSRRTIDDATLHRALIAEIATTLECRQRLVPLPRNIVDVQIGPAGEPCFVASEGASSSPDPAGGRVARHAPGFRLLLQARLVGHHGDRCLAVTSSPYSSLSVFDGETSRTIALPAKTFVLNAYRAGDRWVSLTSAGVIGEHETMPWAGTENLRSAAWHRMVRVGADGLAAVSVDRAADATKTLRHVIWDRGRLTSGTLPIPGDIPLAAVRRADGCWLAIGSQIVELRADRPPLPTEPQLQAALTAARAGDWAVLRPLLANLSSYPGRETRGLATMLQTLPQSGLPLQAVSDMLEKTRRELSGIPATEGLAPTQADRVTEMLEACERQLRETVANLGDVVPDLRLGSAPQIAARLGSGMQFYRDRWITVLAIVRQDTIDSALLWVRLADDRPHGPFTTALARLEPDGSLRIVANVPVDVEPGRCSYVVAPDSDTMYASVNGRGIVRIGPRDTAWIATGGRLKGSADLRGVDCHGRLYLRQTPPSARGSLPLEPPPVWVLTPESPEGATVAVRHWPTTGPPPVSSADGIWFLRRPGPRTATGPQGAAPDVDLKRIDVRAAPDPDAQGVQPTFPGTPDGPLPCLLTGPRAVTEYRMPAYPAASFLAAGHKALWFFGPQRGADVTTAILSGELLRASTDPHALAERQFDALLAAAPLALSPHRSSDARPGDAGDSPPQLLRVGDMLCVNANGRVEIYARGRPLAVNDRLVLAGLLLDQARLVGPFGPADRPAVLVLANPTQGERFAWMTPTATGVQIEKGLTREPGPQPPPPPVPINVTLAAGDRSALLVDDNGGRIWQVLGPGSLRFFADAGVPLLGLPGDDGFLAAPVPFARHGVRLCTASARIDVPVLYTRRLTPVAVRENGQILCLQPDGLAWLQPHPEQGYTLAMTSRLPHGLTPTSSVGRLGTAEVITAYDWNYQPQLVVVQDAATASTPAQPD
jgi:hypothetical protein